MSTAPHIDAASPAFPGDPSPQPPFNFRDSLRSLVLWPVGIGFFAAAVASVWLAAKFTDLRRIDSLLKWYSRLIPSAIGVKVNVKGADLLDLSKSYVYVLNHVNIFDMLVVYQAIPQYTRAFEHIDHFSWPIVLTVARRRACWPRSRMRWSCSKERARSSPLPTDTDNSIICPPYTDTLQFVFRSRQR